MVRLNLRRLAVCGIVAASAFGMGASTAQAGWHWHGGSAGYVNASWGHHGGHGSFGSHGAYSGYGSHGSAGGWRLGSRLHAWHAGRGSHGSHGSYRHHGTWGSNGGSFGSSSGSYGGGSYGGGSYGGGSSGGSYGGSHGWNGGGKVDGTMGYPPAAPMQPEPPAIPPPPAPGELGPFDGNQANLKVSVPQDALVYVNGLLTRSTGTTRSYLSRGLASGLLYNYEVRAEAMRDGKRVEETKLVQLKAGDTLELAFESLQSIQAKETTLTLNVPAEANVTLGGNATQGEGEVRVFTTTKLGLDREWSDYVVRVSIERDGRMVTQEKTLTLKAGDKRSLTFDFDGTKVADAR